MTWRKLTAMLCIALTLSVSLGCANGKEPANPTAVTSGDNENNEPYIHRYPHITTSKLPISAAKGLTKEEIVRRLWSMYLEQFKCLPPHAGFKINDYKITSVTSSVIPKERSERLRKKYLGTVVEEGNELLFYIEFTVVPTTPAPKGKESSDSKPAWPSYDPKRAAVMLIKEKGYYMLLADNSPGFDTADTTFEKTAIPVSEVQDLDDLAIVNKLWGLFLKQYKSSSVDETFRLVDYRVEKIEVRKQISDEVVFNIFYSVHPYLDQEVIYYAKYENLLGTGRAPRKHCPPTAWTTTYSYGGQMQADGWVRKYFIVGLIEKNGLYTMENTGY